MDDASNNGGPLIMVLDCARDVVRYSCLVQNSISALNLDLGRNSKILPPPRFETSHPSILLFGDMIRSEGDCHNFTHRRRSFINSLDLEYPQARTRSYGRFCSNDMSRQMSIEKVHVANEFRDDIIFQLVSEACENRFNKYKILKWFVKFNSNLVRNSSRTPVCILRHMIDCIRPSVVEPGFLVECLQKFHLGKSFEIEYKPKNLLKILYHVHLIGRTPEIMKWCNGLITRYLSKSIAGNINEVLKFQDNLESCDYFTRILNKRLFYYLTHFRYFLSFATDLTLKNWTLKRYNKFIYLCFVEHSETENFSEIVRLVWHSDTDPFLSFEEMTELNKIHGITHEEVKSLYELYSEAVGASPSTVEPRSLQHLCRCKIRNVLYENNHWLPEAIARTGLPQKLQSYLNLDVGAKITTWKTPANSQGSESIDGPQKRRKIG